MRRTTWLIVAALTAGSLCFPIAAAAQSAAYAANRNIERSRHLAFRAIELLDEGEDAIQEKLKAQAFAEGERLAREAVELDERNSEAYYALFANQGRRLQTEGMGPNPMILWNLNKALDRCLELNPRHYNALVARGGMYRQLPRILGGSTSKALDFLTRAVEVNPEAVGGRIELARAHMDRGDLAAAKKILQRAAYWAELLAHDDDLTEARLLLYELEAAPAGMPPLCSTPIAPVTLAHRTF